MSVRLARKPAICFVLRHLGYLNRDNLRFIAFAKENGIRWANASRRIPERNGSLDALYASHVIEHLYPAQARSFLAEALRVLKPGGVIRIAISDLRFHVDNYLAHGDADRFVDLIMLATPQPGSAIDRVRNWVVGYRHQMWKYDGPSAVRLLECAGFASPRIMPAGQTLIADPGALNLSERAPESAFVEAYRPQDPMDAPLMPRAAKSSGNTMVR